MTQLHGAVPDDEQTVRAASVDSDPALDGVIEHLGLHDAAGSPADETETEMSDETAGDISQLSTDEHVLDQLDEVASNLAELDGETAAAEPEALDALSLLREALAAERAQLDAERQQFEAELHTLEESRAALEQREARMKEHDDALASSMSPEEASHAAALKILEEEIVRRTAELNQQRRTLDKERTAFEEAQTNWRIEHKNELETLEAERQKFTTRQRMIRQEQAEWDKKSAEFNAERTRLREQKQLLQQQQAELAEERERVEMQAATILVGARVAQLTVNDQNERDAEKKAFEAERAEFQRQRQELDDLRAAVEQQQQTLELAQRELQQTQQELERQQQAAAESRDQDREDLQARLAELESTLAETRQEADSARRQLEEQSAEIARQQEEFAEQRRQWEQRLASEITKPHDDAGSSSNAEPHEPTTEEQSAAMLHMMGVHTEGKDQPCDAEQPQMQELGQDAGQRETSVLDVGEQATAADDLDLLDDSAIRLARLRAEAMGLPFPESAPNSSAGDTESPVEPARFQSAGLPGAIPSPERTADRPLAQRVVIDKDETREQLQAMREVSQRSAQHALSAHQSRALRGSIVMRSLIALMAFGGAAWFLSTDLVGQEMFWLAGHGFLVIGIFMAFDAFQKAIQLGIITARRRHLDCSSKSPRSRSGD